MARIVLVPLDGSSLAERALPVAATVAATPGRQLRVIHAAGGPARDDAPTQAPSLAVQEAEAYCGRLMDRFAGGTAVDVTADIIHGDPSAVLLHEVSGPGVELLVMSTHGGRGPDGEFAAHRTRRVLAACTGPMMLLGPRVAASAAPEEPIPAAKLDTMLIGLDGSAAAQAILPYSVGLARALRCRITLLSVLDTAHGDAGQALETRTISAHAYLDRIAAGAGGTGIAVSQRVLPSADIAAAILRAADLEEAHIIAVTSSSGGRADRFGRNFQAVLRNSSVPVLACHPAR